MYTTYVEQRTETANGDRGWVILVQWVKWGFLIHAIHKIHHLQMISLKEWKDAGRERTAGRSPALVWAPSRGSGWVGGIACGPTTHVHHERGSWVGNYFGSGDASCQISHRFSGRSVMFQSTLEEWKDAVRERTAVPRRRGFNRGPDRSGSRPGGTGRPCGFGDRGSDTGAPE